MNSIECRKGLPTEYELFLINKYNSFITTCRYIEVYYPLYDINYILIFEDDKLDELIVFGNKGNTSICFNSLVYIKQNVVEEFLKIIFKKFQFINKIKIEASYFHYNLKKTLLLSKSDNQILNLPSSIESYYLELGYHTRKNIRNRKVRLLRDYKNVNFITKYGNEIEEKIVDKIIQLNTNRMIQKGKIPGIDQNYRDNIYRYSQHYGCVSYIEIDGILVAGCIATILNKEIFLHVIAHDNNLSKYNVGEVCIVNYIEYSINKGMTTFQFLWGETELKKRFLAKSHVLYSYCVYRAYSLDFILKLIKRIFYDSIIQFKNLTFSTDLRKAIKKLY